MLAGEDVAGAAHVGGELVDLVDPLDGRRAQGSGSRRSPTMNSSAGASEYSWRLRSTAAHPEAFGLESLDQMAADETTGAVNQNAFCHVLKAFRHVLERNYPFGVLDANLPASQPSSCRVKKNRNRGLCFK